MKESRFPELDTLRGLAVLLMVLYHAAFDLRFFYGWPLDVFHGEWLILARTSAVLFLLVSGICFTLSWERTTTLLHLQKTVKRFLVLALSAAIVSFVTWLIAPQDFIKFGILHLFALSTLLLPLFAPLKLWNALLGLLILILSFYKLQTTNYSLLVLFGSPPPSFSSLDYFPLIPWFGVLLLGIALGHAPYFHPSPQRSQAVRAQRDAASEFIEQASTVWRSVGRHSLILYLLHQPLLLTFLWMLHSIFQTRAG